MSQTSVLEGWMRRATAYELLSLAFLLPTGEVAEALAAGEYAAACDEAFGALDCDDGVLAEVSELLAGYEGEDPDEVFHSLRREHTRLFVGERFPPITPFVGVWAAERHGQQGMLFVGRKSMEIERFMRERGVAKNLAAGQTNDPVDHVGTMCEFLKFLCLVNAKAVRVPANASVEEGDYQEFVADHFAGYAAWCSAQVLELARIPFFRAAALLLGEIVALPIPSPAA